MLSLLPQCVVVLPLDNSLYGKQAAGFPKKRRNMLETPQNAAPMPNRNTRWERMEMLNEFTKDAARHQNSERSQPNLSNRTFFSA